MPALPEPLLRDIAETRSRPHGPTHPGARGHYLQGVDLLKHGRYSNAESCFRRALQFNADDPDVLNNLGNSVWQQGRSPEAVAYFLKAYQYKPDDFGILNNLGIILWEQNRPDRAVSYYRRALQLQPDAFDAKMNLGV